MKTWSDLPKYEGFSCLNKEQLLLYYSLSNIDKLKYLLRNEISEIDGDASVYIASNNEDEIILQFGGFSINLYSDKTWIWEDTTGG